MTASKLPGNSRRSSLGESVSSASVALHEKPSIKAAAAMRSVGRIAIFRSLLCDSSSLKSDTKAGKCRGAVEGVVPVII